MVQAAKLERNSRPRRDPPVVTPRCAHPSWFRLDWADGLLGLLALVPLTCCFRGEGDPLTWLLLILLLPVLRLLGSPEYRGRLLGWLERQWVALQTFATHRGRPPWSAVFVYAVLPTALVYLFEDRTLGALDTVPVIPTAASLVIEGNWDLNEYLPAGVTSEQLPYCVQQRATGIYSSYPAGMVQFALPVVALAHLAGADLSLRPVAVRLEKWTAAWVASWSIGLFLLIALHLTDRESALVAAGLLALASAMFSTAGQALWQHGGIIFWSLMLLLTEFRHRERPSRLGVGIAGLACASMLACRLSAVVFLVPFGVWVVLRAPRRALAMAGIAAAAYLPWALTYASIYGTPFGPSTHQMAAGNWTPNLLISLAGVLVSPARGVLVYQPWLLLGLATCIPWFHRQSVSSQEARGPAGWAWYCATVIVLQVLLVSAWCIWWGGHCWGSRLAADVIPLAALLCVRPVAVLWRTGSGRRLVIVLGVIGFLLHFSAVHFFADSWNRAVDIDNHTGQLWSWTSPPFLHWALR